ncbi:CRAL-TRIO domain-containing protein [Teratosphaeria destructans]|uniref:CRAL-TRIO domain-containing protein n=1 Tax=Teratosphaeria destructans TaxID=418781 RepID=A0A9W7T158_9PEZI|nr:CRAL-TRIO domain-containing protein [Teratosphaeria destructans]
MLLPARTLIRQSFESIQGIPDRARVRISRQYFAQWSSPLIKPPPPPLRHNFKAQRARVDPTAFLVAAAVSGGVAYAVTRYTDSNSSQPFGSNEQGECAQLESTAMAANALPGRPGNLTPEQTAKLKEMWERMSEITGVSTPSINGSSTPSTEAARPPSPDGKKKKSRLSIFRKKDKADAGSETSSMSGVDNDKHGQTKEYEAALEKMTPQELRDALWSMVKHDDPDALYLRFLRARKWDVQAAIVMMISTMHWRAQEMHVDDDIMPRGEEYMLKEEREESGARQKEGADFLAQLRMGKSFLHGTDKDGRPCCYVRVRLHHGGEQSEPSLERFTVYTIETARLMLRAPIDTATIVFDMTDFSMANMDYTPVKFMIKCFEANYPESLGSVIVYKSPWIFHGIWKIIKGWLDPVVASKVHFASNVNDLESVIPRPRAPRELGGDEDWEYAYVEPVPGENKAMSDTATRDAILRERAGMFDAYEKETQSWLAGDESAVLRRSGIARRLAESYWKLDPYVRARSLYDRIGVLGPNGTLDFYPKAAPSSAAAPATAPASAPATAPATASALPTAASAAPAVAVATADGADGADEFHDAKERLDDVD